MDPTKPRAPHVNNGGGHEALMDEAPVPWRDVVDGERQRDTDTRDTDVVAAELNHNHRGSADKHKFNRLCYQRRTKQKVVTDFSTLSKGPSAGTKPRAALRQVLFSQGASEKNPASEERGQLDVLKQELGAFAVPLNLKWRWKEESQGTTLEKNWTEVVLHHSTMSKMQKHQQEALWEFVHTELTYINKLIIIRDLVIAALVNLHQHGFLLEVTPELLFSNLPSILAAHQLFWQEAIYPMLEEVRRTGEPFDPMLLEAGCLQFHERFSSYQHYCWEEENNLEFTRRQMESDPHFLTYVQWVETHPQCERMRLGDMQAKPHQRITKYPLLLKAVLKSTQDLHVQHTLRGMLSSVNGFLESINDYLRLKDEELALTISAQRVEGYEAEGINEDIDKLVRAICQFDLTCPIRGVGPDVVRKLLLEENLKIRGRKDSKLEVVALLFSDVLLMTKVQKKGERLKVVRPPLALDRTCCVALKDGCSFVLVEVGDLRSVRNVYVFTAGTSKSCSTWVSTIHQAKETLWNLRQTEGNRQQENWKIKQLVAKPASDAETDGMETEGQPFMESRRETLVDELTEELIIPRSVNGTLASKETEGQYQPPDVMVANNPVFSFWHSQANTDNHKPVHKGFTGQQQALKGYEWIEMRVRGEEVRVQTEEVEKREQRGFWNQRAQSAPNLDHFNLGIAADPLRYNTTGPRALLYPDVDYPTDEESTSRRSYQPAISREAPELFRLREEGRISTSRESQSVNQDLTTNSHHRGDMDKSPETWGCSRNLKSPVLRRRRPNSGHQAHSSQTAGQFFQGSRQSKSLPSGSGSHRVLKLGSLKQNQEMLWSMQDRVSPDPRTWSESELPDLNVRNGAKTQRSASIPNNVIEGGHGLRLHSRSLHSPRAEDTPPPVPRRHSTLEGLLERAKGRDVLKRDWVSVRSRYPPYPPVSATPSASEWEEEEVELMRHRALTVSKGWKEQLVDGDEDDKGNSVIFSDGVNVDWSGWCFDDDEVMDHLNPGGEGFLEGTGRPSASFDLRKLSEQEDGEYSQV